ncbi:hypothetical protein BZL30_2836 [Mycobacterium kansasii]|uniref:Uncharacterized protein n=1 Tax=Mycobacterium kansasii TaxID=1768 RepID=A0A1V3XJZ5_MYCKA|nr:hypothetical protein BZL30_2836 [Mycobacterium kansasii]
MSSHTIGDTAATQGRRSSSLVRVNGPRTRASAWSNSRSVSLGACVTSVLKAAAKPRLTGPDTQ